MNRHFLTLICSILLCFFLSNCANKKDVVYFQDGYEPQKNIGYLENYPKIRPFDKLIINVATVKSTSRNTLDETNAFNLVSNTSSNPTPHKQYYVIPKSGCIKFPNIKDSILVKGKSRFEVAQEIEKLIETEKGNEDYVVNVDYVDFKINVLGEVTKPGSYSIEKDRITIMEALALAGDLTIQGKRKNVKIIRETETVSKVFTIDLTSNEIFDSEAYFLQQNDIVYVEPNNSKIQTAVTNYSTLLSVAGILISIVAILIK